MTQPCSLEGRIDNGTPALPHYRTKTMEDVVITSGVRTAIGKFQGSLADVPASDLGAHVIREAVARAGIDPGNVDQVVMGIVGQVAEDAYLSRHRP